MSFENFENRSAKEAEVSGSSFGVNLAQRQSALQWTQNDKLQNPLSPDGKSIQINASALYGDRINLPSDSHSTHNDASIEAGKEHQKVVEDELRQLMTWLQSQGYPKTSQDRTGHAQHTIPSWSEPQLQKTMKIANQLPEGMRQSFVQREMEKQ